MKSKSHLITNLIREIELRKDEMHNQTIETIYFGGGTPSILIQKELDTIIDAIYKHHNVSSDPEISLEANPDDMNEVRLQELAKSSVNRLSLGVQSFFDEHLRLMNRAHNGKEAKCSLSVASRYFKNISVDLIYGIPGLSNQQWRQNIQTALSFGIEHISSYALTVEPKTALESFINRGIIENVCDAQAQEQFMILIEELTERKFVHYELSNFGKEGAFSRNNSSYWQGKYYLGIGPSAHSYDGKQRSWNVKSNVEYNRKIQNNQLPIERELLSKTDRYNEYVMTGLRTIWGVSLERILDEFGKSYRDYLLLQSEKHRAEELLYIDGHTLKTTQKGKFLSDGISADLFKLKLF